jgi:hypothetical protein
MGLADFERYSWLEPTHSPAEGLPLMLFSVPATAVGLCLMLPGVVLAATPAAAQTASVTAARATAVPSTEITTPEGSASDAAARHAKRTECIKEAKAKKLVGADKSSFIKDCVAAH